MEAGRLKTRITILKKISFKDSNGVMCHDWIKYKSLWADVRQQSGIEAIKADKIISITKASIRIRFNKSIDQSMRVIIDNDMTYEINAIIHDLQNNDYSDLICSSTS